MNVLATRARRVAMFALTITVMVATAAATAPSAHADAAPRTVAPVDTTPVPGIPDSGTGTDTGTGTGDTVPDNPAGITVPSPDGVQTPTVDVNGSDQVVINTPKGTSNAVLLVLMVTLVSIVPGLLMLTTTFPRFLVVLGLTRQGLGLNTTPPNQVLAGIAAFLTLFVMAPTFSKINEVAIQPAMHGEMTQGEAIHAGWEPLRDFMLERTRSSDLRMLYDMTDTARPADKTEVSARYLIPAFILSELRAAFLIGFLIWVPFLLIDLIVSTVLASLGMLMMPPVVVSLPVKLALFVLVDGWALLVGSLLRSAGVG